MIPFVMNIEMKVGQAYGDYYEGKFGAGKFLNRKLNTLKKNLIQYGKYNLQARVL